MFDPNQLFIAYKECESVSFINTHLKFPNKAGTLYALRHEHDGISPGRKRKN